MNILSYEKNVPLEFNNKRSCGLWFIIIGIVMIVAAITGGDMCINPEIFGVGYSIGFYIAIGNKKIRSMLSQGSKSKFQKNMSIISILFLAIFMILFTLPYWNTSDYRMIWLLCLLAVGVHFYMFYFVHGFSMILIGTACIINSMIGIVFPTIPFLIIGITDGIIKLCFGIYLLFFSKPTRG